KGFRRQTSRLTRASLPQLILTLPTVRIAVGVKRRSLEADKDHQLRQLLFFKMCEPMVVAATRAAASRGKGMRYCEIPAAEGSHSWPFKGRSFRSMGRLIRRLCLRV